MNVATAEVCQGLFMLLALVAIVTGCYQCQSSSNKCQAECLKSARAADECRWVCS